MVLTETPAVGPAKMLHCKNNLLGTVAAKVHLYATQIGTSLMYSTKSMFSAFSPWADMAVQSTMLAIESQQVIAMRLTKFAMGGPGVDREATLMVSEKMESLAQVGQMVMMAALGGHHDMGAGKVVRHYRKKVSANVRRLAG
jgi:hypothetical protein